MRALVLYTVLVSVGTVIATFIGLFVEREITDAGSVAVFLALFFANFMCRGRSRRPSSSDP